MTILSRMARLRRCLLINRPPLALGLMLIIVVTGCSTIQLDTFRKRASDGDHGWIADQTVTCEEASAVCGQLHLIKGDACFRLAKAGTAAVDNYACAADELTLGVALNPSWEDAAIHRQFQENICDSLQNLQARQSGDAARETLARLMDAAEALYRLAPKSVPAVYYLAKARLEQVQPLVPGIHHHSAARVPVCNRLKRTLTGVLSTMETARQKPLPDWERFADDYQRLCFELGLAMRAAGCP